MKSEEGAAPDIEEIQIPLLNEGTDVWRPTLGRRISASRLVFRVLATPDYDPKAEQWAFVPGTVVACQFRNLSGGLCLVGVRAEATPDSDSSTVLSEEVARSAGVSLLVRGGLRLVAASESTRFLDECARRAVKVGAIDAYKLEGEGVVLVGEAFRNFLTSDFRPADLSIAKRIAIARRFCSEHAAPELWVDLLLSDPGAASGETSGGHLAPLPTAAAALRPVEPLELSSLRQALEAGRGGLGEIHLAEFAAGEGRRLDPRLLLRDLVVLAFGNDTPGYIRIHPVERVWQSLPRDAAIAFATKAVAHDLAYHHREMEDGEARAIVERFVGLFGPNVEFHTNQDIGRDGLPSSGFPITSATMEATLGASDGRRVGLLIITGED